MPQKNQIARNQYTLYYDGFGQDGGIIEQIKKNNFE